MTALARPRLTPYVSTLLRDEYFAAAVDLELGDKLWSKYEDLARRQHPMGDLWAAAYSHYYGDESVAGRTWGMTRRGDQGELAAIRINRSRRNSKARQALILAGIIKPKARASNSDAEAAYAAQLAELLAEYDFKKGGIDSLWAYWVELSEVFADAYAFTRWNPNKGRMLGDLDGLPVFEGDVESIILPPWLIEKDEGYPTAEASPYNYVRTYESKIDLILEYNRTLDGRTGDEVADLIWNSPGDERLQRITRVQPTGHDTACVVTFIHKPCKLMPNGLYVRMLDGNCVLERRTLFGDGDDYDPTGPYPLLRLAADEMVDTPHAWAPFWNQLAAQELSDALLTSHASLLTTYLDPIYAVPANSGNAPEKLASGPGRKWTVASGDSVPKLIERPEVTESAMQFDERVAAEMEQDMALNDAVFGRQDGHTKNAQADALQASQAVQQVAPAARAARMALSLLQELRVKTLRKNARGDRLLKVVGQGKAYLLNAKTYSPEQLKAFEGFEYEDGNPMELTPQGRWSIIHDIYMPLNLLKSTEDVDTALATGRLEPVVDPIRDENLLIKSENDAIRRGENPPVFVTQNHVLHMRKHMSVTMNPSALQDGQLLQGWSAHNDVHYAQYYGLPPGSRAVDDPFFHQRWLYIMGLSQQDVPPPLPQPGMAPGAPGGPPPGGAPPPGAPPAGAKPGGPPQMPPNGPAAVKPPKNPLNGQAFSNTTPPLGGGT